MSKIHKDMISKDFPKPLSGVIECTVCSTSGMVLSDACGEHKTTQWFLEGTQPTQICPIHTNKTGSVLGEYRIQKEMYRSGQRPILPVDTSPLTINWALLDDNYALLDYAINSTEEDSDYYPEETHEDIHDDLDYNFLME